MLMIVTKYCIIMNIPMLLITTNYYTYSSRAAAAAAFSEQEIMNQNDHT